MATFGKGANASPGLLNCHLLVSPRRKMELGEHGHAIPNIVLTSDRSELSSRPLTPTSPQYIFCDTPPSMPSVQFLSPPPPPGRPYRSACKTNISENPMLLSFTLPLLDEINGDSCAPTTKGEELEGVAGNFKLQPHFDCPWLRDIDETFGERSNFTGLPLDRPAKKPVIPAPPPLFESSTDTHPIAEEVSPINKMSSFTLGPQSLAQKGTFQKRSRRTGINAKCAWDWINVRLNQRSLRKIMLSGFVQGEELLLPVLKQPEGLEQSQIEKERENWLGLLWWALSTS